MSFRSRESPGPGSEVAPRSGLLTYLRLIAAYAVLWSHSFALVGLPQPEVAPGINVGVGAVFVFFAISGYLVWVSWERSSSIAAYVANRLLRIYPALVVNVVLTALLLGPLVSSLPLHVYITDQRLFEFLADNLKPWGFYAYLPGVFEGNPYPGAVNGSLWTIGYEIFMYCIVLVIGLTGEARRRPFVWSFFLLCASVFVFSTLAGSPHVEAWARNKAILGYSASNVALLGGFFSMGVALALYRAHRLWQWPPAILAALALLIASRTQYFVPVAWVALPYIILFLGFSGALQVFPEPKNDYSYGVYLYAWPIQQVVVSFGFEGNDHALYLIVTAALTSVFAILSWHLVEAPALRLKRRFAAWLPIRRLHTRSQ